MGARLGLTAFLFATLSAATFVAPALAAPRHDAAARRFDPDDPAYAALHALEQKGERLENDDAALTLQNAAWQALYDAAIRIRVGASRLPHPLAGRALIAMAMNDQIAGAFKLALPKAQRSLELLRPFRDRYADQYIQAVSVIGFLQQALGDRGAALASLAEGADWYERQVAASPEDRQDRTIATALSNIEFAYSQALSAIGQADKAVEYQRRSMEARRTGLGPNDPDTVSAYSWYAIMLFRAGRRDEADAYGRLAVQTATDHVDPANIVYPRALEAFGSILARGGRRNESVSYFERSIALKRAHGGADNNNFYYALFNLGDSLIQLERYDEGRALEEEAAKGWRKLEGDDSSQGALAWAYAGLAEAGDGETASAVKRLEEALGTARGKDSEEQIVAPKVFPALIAGRIALGQRDQARALAAQFAREAHGGDTTMFAQADADLVKAYADADWPGATVAARRLIAAVRSDRLLGSSGDLPQPQRTAIDLALRVAVETDSPQLALEAMVILAGSKIAQANHLVAERISAADPVLATRVRAEQDAAKTFQTADGALLQALGNGEGVAAARATRDSSARTLDALRAALARDYPAWSEVSGLADPDIAALQRDLPADEALLAAVPAFDGVYTLLVTRDVAQVRRTTASRRAIVDLAGRLRTSLIAGTPDTEAAYALYAQFLPETAALARIRSLRIVPAGPLASLPFAALLTRPVVRLDRPSPWLIRRYALSVATGFAPETALGERQALPDRFLGVGAPSGFGGAPASEPARLAAASSYFRGSAIDASAIAALPPLPGTRAELDAIARDFGSDRARLLLGDAANESDLRAMDLTPYGTIVFATHALVGGEMEGVAEPGLVLARPHGGEPDDGVLTASEVATLKLDADWVILSACNTAAGDGVSDTAYSGLAQAFRFAGARTLMLSHWPVRDDAAAFVTVRTIANARRGMRRDVALQQAMLALIDSKAIPDATNPYIWAPYILVGTQ